MDPIPAQANVRARTVDARADGSPITAGTVNYYVVALTGDNAGKWFRDSDDTWQAAEAICGAMTHKADGHWTVSVAAGAWIDGVEYLEYAKESGDLHVPTLTHFRSCALANVVVPDAAGTAAGLHATTDGKVDTNKTELDGLQGSDGKAAISTDAQDLSATLDVNAKLIEGADPSDTIRDAVVDDATRIDASSVNAVEGKVDTNKTELDGLQGSDGKAAISTDAQDLSATLDVNAKLLAGASPNNITATNVVTALFTNASMKQMLAFARGKVVITGSAIVFYDTDDTTPLYTLTISTGGRTVA